jgi:hypothetical protein
MEFLDHWRPRVILLGRLSMWVLIGLFIVVGLFSNSPAWAETTTCTGNSTGGHSSITPTPITIYLKYGGPSSTYQVALCGDPAPGDEVRFTTAVQPPNRVNINPTTFVLDDTDPQTVAVSVRPSWPRREPFTANIAHTAQSNNPGFNGTVRVTAYYSPPLAIPDIALGAVGQPLDIPVLNNDFDRVNMGGLDVDAIVRDPFRGTTSINANQTVRYTPSNRAPRVDAFIYRAIDEIGNTDNAIVVVALLPINARNPNAFLKDPDIREIFIVSETVEIEVPQIRDVPEGSDVYCLYSEIASTSGNLNAPPVPMAKFTGFAFYFECYVNGEPITEEQLTEPATLSVQLPDGFLENREASRLLLAEVEENGWRTAGVENVSGPGATVLGVRTSIFGEFAVFDSRTIFFPLVEAPE